MSTTRGSAHYPGLLPIDPAGEPMPIRPTTLENERVPNWQPSLRKRAPPAVSSLIAFCAGVAATLAWWSYGDAARHMISISYPQLGWLAPRQAAVQKAPDTIALAGPADPHPDHRQLDAILRDLHAMRQSLDQIVAGQELTARSIDEITTSIAAGQAPTARSTDQTAAIITTGQAQMSRNQTTTSVDQAPSAKASSVESRADGAALQPAVRTDIKPSEARLPQTLSERGKQLSAASGHDASCFSSAAAVLQNHPRAWPTWTLKAPGHEGTLCWYAAARPRGSDHRPRVSDHRGEMARTQETVGTTETTENKVSAPPAPYTRPPE
jgi:DNA-binding transcriptional regulator YdaS (Cro superfamily)